MQEASLDQALIEIEANLPKARIIYVSTNFKNLAYMNRQGLFRI